VTRHGESLAGAVQGTSAGDERRGRAQGTSAGDECRGRAQGTSAGDERRGRAQESSEGDERRGQAQGMRAGDETNQCVCVCGAGRWTDPSQAPHVQRFRRVPSTAACLLSCLLSYHWECRRIRLRRLTSSLVRLLACSPGPGDTCSPDAGVSVALDTDAAITPDTLRVVALDTDTAGTPNT
jgi:hypothetical protein